MIDTPKETHILTGQHIKIQTMLLIDTLIDFENNDFALGYVFGVANMDYYQKGGTLEDQDSSLTFILLVFTVLFGENGLSFFRKALQIQKNIEFIKGNEVGANEVGSYYKSNGKVIPMGLVEAFDN